MSMQVFGVAMIARKFQKMSGAPEKALKKWGLKVERETKKKWTSGPLRAKQTGNLVASVRMTPTKPDEVEVHAGGGDHDVNYAVYVHEGTRYMTGRPAMQRAIEETQKELAELVKAEIRKAAVGF